MSHKQNHEGHGGSYVVGESEVKKVEGTLNPGDAGYQEAVRKVPVHDPDRKGALKRAPTFRDLEERPKAPAKVERSAAASDTSTPQGGKRP